MRQAEKFRSDLDRWIRQDATIAAAPDMLDRLRGFFFKTFPKIPHETMAGFFTAFLSRFGKDEDTKRRALDWLGSVGSLLQCDYDGTALTRDDWSEIREIIALDAGEIDMEVLGYVMSRVVEHGGV